MVAKVPGKQLGEAGLWASIAETTIGAGLTVTVETNALSSFNGIEYSLAIFDLTPTLIRFQKMAVVKQSPGLKDTVYAKIGSTVDLTLTAEVSGTDMVLKITNNEIFDIKVKGARLLF